MPFLWEVSGISIYLSDVEFVTKVKSDNFVKYFQARVKFSRISGISIYQRWSLVGKDDYLCWKLICSQPVIRSYLYPCFSYTIFVLIFANQIISFSKYLPPLTFPSTNNLFFFSSADQIFLQIFSSLSSSILLLLWGAEIFVSSSKNRIHKFYMG